MFFSFWSKVYDFERLLAYSFEGQSALYKQVSNIIFPDMFDRKLLVLNIQST